jgi:hypothetical protein
MNVTLPLQPQRDDLAHFDVSPVADESIRNRIVIERAIVRRACEDLIAAGFELRVHDGEAWATGYTIDLDIVMCSIMATDEESIIVRPVGQPGPRGSIFLVYGNDGYDVIADNSTNIEEHLKGATELADAIEEAVHSEVEAGLEQMEQRERIHPHPGMNEDAFEQVRDIAAGFPLPGENAALENEPRVVIGGNWYVLHDDGLTVLSGAVNADGSMDLDSICECMAGAADPEAVQQARRALLSLKGL